MSFTSIRLCLKLYNVPVEGCFKDIFNGTFQIFFKDDLIGFYIAMGLLKFGRQLTWTSLHDILRYFKAYGRSFPNLSCYKVSKMIHSTANPPFPQTFERFYVRSTCITSCEHNICRKCMKTNKKYQVALFLVTDIEAQLTLLLSRVNFIKKTSKSTNTKLRYYLKYISHKSLII